MGSCHDNIKGHKKIWITMSEIVINSPSPLTPSSFFPRKRSTNKDKLWRLAIELAITKNLHNNNSVKNKTISTKKKTKKVQEQDQPIKAN